VVSQLDSGHLSQTLSGASAQHPAASLVSAPCLHCGCVDTLVLYCAVLCCAVLCCAVLCCAVLCCAVLCCAVQVPGSDCWHRAEQHRHRVSSGGLQLSHHLCDRPGAVLQLPQGQHGSVSIRVGEHMLLLMLHPWLGHSTMTPLMIGLGPARLHSSGSETCGSWQ
jgi:hypothetical protein